jgi:hypothetical protein
MHQLNGRHMADRVESLELRNLHYRIVLSKEATPVEQECVVRGRDP